MSNSSRSISEIYNVILCTLWSVIQFFRDLMNVTPAYERSKFSSFLSILPTICSDKLPRACEN